MRAKHAKLASATALVVAGSLIGCAAQVPAGPGVTGPIGADAGMIRQLAPSQVGSAEALSPREAAGLGADPAATLPAPGAAPSVAIPERDELAIPAETLQYRAPINSLEDVLKQSGLGPVPESQAPSTEMLKRILPQRLSQAQAQALLVKIPADMVQASGLDLGDDDLAVGSGGGQIAASSARTKRQSSGTPLRWSDDDKYDRGGSSYGDRRHSGSSYRGRGDDQSYKGRRGGQSYGGRQDSQSYGDRGHGDKGRHDKGGRGHGTRWSGFWAGDTDLLYASSWGWNDFAYAGSYFFFPTTIFGALHFYPYTFAAGFYYPAYCPFYFSAAFFIPYCQAPVVWAGTFGLVSGCPTCPISGRPLLWFPGEVPII